ncbi:MAG: hypothetical protein L3K03_08350 [Thermoplasmata archaeon]|nr:hypothetical protein [Thermoplasmata archaeon]
MSQPLGGSPLRDLTDAEARVLALLLANPSSEERERLRISHLPRSTYHASRRRAYAEGWLRDRYIPAPIPFGYPEITIAVARPFAEKLGELLERWSSEPGAVLVQGSTQLALGVVFHRSADEARKSRARLGNESFVSAVQLLAPKLADGGVPVYFDYEGIWTHLVGNVGSRSYPQGLPTTPWPEEGRPAAPIWTPRHRWAAGELLGRPFVAESQGRAGHLVGPFGLPRAQKHVIEAGWVVHRVLCDPAKVPAYHDRHTDQMVLIVGEYEGATTPRELFEVLTRECRVYPFLYATDKSRVLIGALGQSLRQSPSGGPVEPSRRPVMPTLQAVLHDIELWQEDAAALSTPVDHRYERLSPPAG